jgi:hypothetical protein
MRDEVSAFCLDRAVLMFGKTVENDIQERTKDASTEKAGRAKAIRLFAQWMTREDETPRGAYRDPMAGR